LSTYIVNNYGNNNDGVAGMDTLDMPNIMELEGTLVSQSSVRTVHVNSREIRVSQAIFLVNSRNRPTLCVIFLWDSDADRIRELKIGSKYKFKVAVNEQRDEIIAFLLPNLTYFKLIKGE